MGILQRVEEGKMVLFGKTATADNCKYNVKYITAVETLFPQPPGAPRALGILL